MNQLTISEIALRVFTSQMEAIQVNLNGCIEGKDPIHLHDLRVANRRLRAAMSEFKALIPEGELVKYQEEFRWIHNITGDVRDLDVSLAHMPAFLKDIPKNWRPYLKPMQDLLEEERFDAQIILAEELASDKVQHIYDGWGNFLESGAVVSGSFAQEPAREYGCRMIVKRYRKVRKKGLSLKKKTPAERFHAYRITVKRLRYLMEFLRPVTENEDYTRLRTGIKIVQDAFGAYQDTDVQYERLLGIANELHQNGTSVESPLALGQLLGVLEKRLKINKKNSLRQTRWLVGDATARSFQSCFQYPVE